MDEEIVESDPTGRYVRYDELLGVGAAKTVYKAIDRDNGIEVAWNAMKLDRSSVNFEKLYTEVLFLKNLNHPNIIEFYDAWVNKKKAELVFITECMTHDLGKFVRKAKHVKLKVIKGWCKQILGGLSYLHDLSPPIIHRDIKCDNIFINGTRGTIKIGDLGLATVKKNKTYYSVIGTPEYMAPEFYDEVYNEKVDIWAFGLCVLEMATLDYPYSECDNAAQIFKRVSSGRLPKALNRIKDEEVKAFIEWCLCRDATRRPTAAQIANCLFLSDESMNDEKSQRPVELYSDDAPEENEGVPADEGINTPPRRLSSLGGSSFSHQFKLAAPPPKDKPTLSSVPASSGEEDVTNFYDNPTIFDLPIEPTLGSSTAQSLDENRVEVMLVDNTDMRKMSFSLKLLVRGGSWSQLAFDFDAENDTPFEVAKEMALSFDLDTTFERQIALEIQRKVDESLAALGRPPIEHVYGDPPLGSVGVMDHPSPSPPSGQDTRARTSSGGGVLIPEPHHGMSAGGTPEKGVSNGGDVSSEDGGYTSSGGGGGASSLALSGRQNSTEDGRGGKRRPLSGYSSGEEVTRALRDHMVEPTESEITGEYINMEKLEENFKSERVENDEKLLREKAAFKAEFDRKMKELEDKHTQSRAQLANRHAESRQRAKQHNERLITRAQHDPEVSLEDDGSNKKTVGAGGKAKPSLESMMMKSLTGLSTKSTDDVSTVVVKGSRGASVSSLHPVSMTRGATALGQRNALASGSMRSSSAADFSRSTTAAAPSMISSDTGVGSRSHSLVVGEDASPSNTSMLRAAGGGGGVGGGKMSYSVPDLPHYSPVSSSNGGGGTK